MGPFDDAWAEAVASSLWPRRLVEAVRIDPAALASARAIRTLRGWRQALSGDDPDAAREARDGLRRVAAALAEPVERDAPRAREIIRPLESDRPSPGASPIRPEPMALARSRPLDEAATPNGDAYGPGGPHDAELELTSAEPEQEGTQVIREAAILEQKRLDGGPIQLPGLEGADGPGPSQRPPAAASQVRVLAALLRPLAEELVPLPHQRRPRRFWARWREVAGDRGVRREVVEALLARVGDVETLLSELIAEVQGTDSGSVARHLRSFEELRAPEVQDDGEAARDRPPEPRAPLPKPRQ